MQFFILNLSETDIDISYEGSFTYCKYQIFLEARAGIEPANRGFAVLCITILLPGLYIFFILDVY